MARMSLPLTTVRGFLVDRTGDFLAERTVNGRGDARFMASEIAFRKRQGEPNWDANIGIAHPTLINAFGLALLEMQKQYDVEW